MQAASAEQQSDELSISESETRGCCLSGSAQGFGSLRVPLASGARALPKPAALAPARTFRSGRAAGLPAVHISVPTSCGFCCCFFPHLSPRGRVAGGVSAAPSPVETRGTGHGVLAHCYSSSPGCQEPKGGRGWRRDHPRGMLSLLGTGSEGEGMIGRERLTQGH